VKIEGSFEVTGIRGRRRKPLTLSYGNQEVLEIERGNTRSDSVENSLRKRLWTCRKADYRMMMALTTVWML
jgi:hypothetical protein